jgi:DNA repair exonuclease SbcCD ATPase subunit
MDVASISGAYQSIKAVIDLLTLAVNAKVEAEAKQRILEAQMRLGELQDTLFGLREQLAQLQEEKAQLQTRLAAAESWNQRIAQYELTETPGGSVVYQFKGAPAHYACPSCTNKQQIHILQDNRTFTGKYRCTGCDKEYSVQPRRDWNA